MIAAFVVKEWNGKDGFENIDIDVCISLKHHTDNDISLEFRNFPAKSTEIFSFLVSTTTTQQMIVFVVLRIPPLKLMKVWHCND